MPLFTGSWLRRVRSVCSVENLLKARPKTSRRRNLGSAVAVELLEPRCLLTTPTLIGSTVLPGANSPWNYSDGALNASAIFADVNNDGKDDVIVTAGNGTIVAYQYSSSGAPLQVLRTYSQTGTVNEIHATPAAAVVPGVGLVIFAGAADGRVFAWNAATGALLPGWPATVDLPDGSQPLSDLRNNI